MQPIAAQVEDRVIPFALPNPQKLLASPLLKHPLAYDAGGDDFHSGGRQFASQNDPDWKIIADWARGMK